MIKHASFGFIVVTATGTHYLYIDNLKIGPLFR